MSDVITVWTKPDCQQCRMVKRRLTELDVPFEERDLTAPAAVKDLEYFRALGFRSAPITEYEGLAVPGFVPVEVDRVAAAWRADHPAHVAVES